MLLLPTLFLYLNMVITFNKNSDLAEIKKLFAQHKGKKTFDAKKIVGTLKFDEDGLKIQQKLRDEWD